MGKRWLVFIFCLMVLIQPLEASRDPLALFPPFCYEGIVTRDTEGVKAGERVTMLESESDKSHLVAKKNGKRVRIPWDAISPIEKAPRSLPAVTPEEVVAFVGEMGFTSKTDFLLFTDLSRFRTYLLEYGDEGWFLVRVLPCSVGDPWHPTPTGSFTILYKCSCIGKTDKYLCRP